MLTSTLPFHHRIKEQIMYVGKFCPIIGLLQARKRRISDCMKFGAYINGYLADDVGKLRRNYIKEEAKKERSQIGICQIMDDVQLV